MRLAGKVAIVTGGGAGIGRATVELFAREGAKVVIADYDEATGAAALEAVRSAGGEAIFLPTDVSSEEQMLHLVETAVATFGGIDILYNNVGGSSTRDGPVTTVPLDEFWRKMHVDLFGTFLGCRLAIPHMIARGGGSVINATSITTLVGMKSLSAYTAAKGAVQALTQQMAVDFAPHKVRVNAVSPGGTLTDRIKARIANPDGNTMSGDSHLLGMSDPIDIAYAVLYLASDESKTTTGHILRVDSGVSIS